MGRSRGTMPIQIAGNVKHGGLFETAFGITLGEIVDDIGGGTADRPAGQARCRSAGRSAPISRARCSTRRSTTRPSPPSDGLIGHAGIVVFDDSVDMAEAGALRHGVLRHRKLRQVHALPHRLDARRRDDRPDRPAAIEPRKTSRCSTDLCNTMKFGSLCALGGFTPYPVMSALKHFPGRFRPGTGQPASRGIKEPDAMSTRFKEIDYGTPGSQSRSDGDAHHRRQHGHGARGHLDHARRDGGRHEDPEALRDRHARRLRLLPPLPGRDRRPRRHARLLHHAGRAGMVVKTQTERLEEASAAA